MNGAQGPIGAQGPTGPAGAQGFTGPAGAQGPIGPSDAFAVNSFAGNATLSTGGPTVVAHLTLSAGSYVFFGSARLLSQGTGTNAECYVQPAGGGANSNDRKIVSLNYAATFGSAVTMNFNCDITTGDAAKADEVFFTAIQVRTVTTQ